MPPELLEEPVVEESDRPAFPMLGIAIRPLDPVIELGGLNPICTDARSRPTCRCDACRPAAARVPKLGS